MMQNDLSDPKNCYELEKLLGTSISEFLIGVILQRVQFRESSDSEAFEVPEWQR